MIRKKVITLHRNSEKNRPMRKDAGVVERGGLENRCTLAGT